MPEEKVQDNGKGVENGPSEPTPASPSPSKRKAAAPKGKLVLARIKLLDGSDLDLQMDVSIYVY